MEKAGMISRIWPIVLTGLVLIAIVFFLTKVVSIIPLTYRPYTGDIQALLFGIILYIVLRFILKTLQAALERRIQKKYVRPLIFLVSIVGYFVILLAILALLGVDLSSIILGSAFAGAIIGLAAQQILSNFFSGILLIWSRPFVPGDYIEFNSWQYSYMLPSYPPKYLSRDEFRWKISGKVDDISMNFTTIIEDDGTVLKLPNSIMIQGATTVNPIRNKIQVRTELMKNVDYEELKKNVESIASKIREITDFRTSVEEIGRETYLVKITLRVTGEDSEGIRARFMESLLAAGR
ncbi:MAG: mechanosensitive ion channel family protein [Candidatus Thermoplasmatota archaeon]|jgi:small-conductance mechanosensitive channel|nr:mechanosensitive ion channel family protein [Candidatus Thermoplasmatota archaeon]